MLWLRSLVYFVFLFVTVVPWAFVVLSGWLFPVHTRFWLCACWTAMAIWGARVICGIKYQVEGCTTAEWPGVVCQSSIDVGNVLATDRDATRSDIRLQARLNWVPFFGWGLRRRNDRIDRSKGQDAFEQVVEQGKDRSRAAGIVYFPKARALSRHQPRYSWGARLAVRTGAWAVPLQSTQASSGEGQIHQTPAPLAYRSGLRSTQRQNAEEVATLVETCIESECAGCPNRYSAPYMPRMAEA